MHFPSPAGALTAGALALTLATGAPNSGRADADDAHALLKAMSDYMAAQQAVSFDYDATLDVVTTEDQRLTLAASGSITLNRPDKIRATRSAGFADVQMLFDGTDFTLFGKEDNIYARIAVPGTIDALIDTLRDTYGQPLPAADLLGSDPYAALTGDVIDTKDLGSGVVEGVECDSFAFRTEEVDWQIWIAQGAEPYPCRFSITSKTVAGGPEYAIQVRNWRTGEAAADQDYALTPPEGATEVDLDTFVATERDFPASFSIGEPK